MFLKCILFVSLVVCFAESLNFNQGVEEKYKARELETPWQLMVLERLEKLEDIMLKRTNEADGFEDWKIETSDNIEILPEILFPTIAPEEPMFYIYNERYGYITAGGTHTVQTMVTKLTDGSQKWYYQNNYITSAQNPGQVLTARWNAQGGMYLGLKEKKLGLMQQWMVVSSFINLSKAGLEFIYESNCDYNQSKYNNKFL